MLQRGSGQESLTALRSPVLTGAGACGSVLVLEDGIPIRPVGTCNVNELFEVNLEQAAAVEILRGPGSVLYGSSAVHGIINVIPPLPDDIPEFGVAIEGGSDAYRRLRLAASSGSNVSGLGIVMHAHRRRRLARFLGIRGTEAERGVGASARGRRPDAPLRRLESRPADARDSSSARTRIATQRSRTPIPIPMPIAMPRASGSQRGISMTRGQELSVFLRSSRMDFLQHFLLGHPVEENGQDSGGLMFKTAGRLFAGGELMLGLDAEVANSFLLQFQDGPTTGGSDAANAIRPAGKQYDYDVDSRVFAGYAQWRRALSPRWSLEAGLRLENARYDYDNRMIDGNTDENDVPCPGGCLYSRPSDRSDDFTNLAPRVGLVWQVQDAVTAYLSLARGFRSPEATELYRLQRQQTVADLDSERADAAELGLRLRTDALALDVALFHMDKRNVILRDSAGFNVSGGRTRHVGLEYQGDWSFAENWILSAAGTVARHEYRFTAAVEQGEQITAGDDVDTAPRDIHGLRLRRETEKLSAELEGLYVGGYWTNAANTARYGGHELLNLRLAVRPRDDWSIGLRVINLFDTAYADRADFAFGNDRYFPGRGRAYFLEIGWRKD